MPISEKMRQRRRKYIGSSDMPALMGLSPFANAADVWIHKTQDTIDEGDRAGSGSPLAVGTYSEAGTIDWARDQILTTEIYESAALIKNQFRVRKGTNHAANCDALITVGGAPVAVVEIKSTAKTHEWGRPLTDEIPEAVLMQVQWQMYVTDLPEAWVAAMLVTVGPDGKVYGGLTYALYRVNADPTIQSALIEVAEKFWSENVETGVMPEDLAPRLETAERMVRTDGKSVKLDGSAADHFDELAEEYLTATAARRDIDKRVREVKATILGLIEDSDSVFTEAHSVDYPERARAAYAAAESTFRVLKVKRIAGLYGEKTEQAERQD